MQSSVAGNAKNMKNNTDPQDFDEAYLVTAVAAAIERRGDEACQRLVSAGADYLPGLIVELYGDVVWLGLTTPAMRAQVDLIAGLINEIVSPVEVVLDEGAGPRTCSGQGLKGRWVEMDEILYRIDLLNPEKPRLYLDQREQHSLVGSLCQGRAVLDLFSHNGAFAMQAMRHGAACAVAVDIEEHYVKAIGANAQRNGLEVEAVVSDAFAYLAQTGAGDFDAIVLDPPEHYFQVENSFAELHRQAFASLPPGGLLATYCRDVARTDFETLVAAAAAQAGREARIFARTSQPFDFPMLLNFPESQILQGLILQVL
jgi:23S rRNA (cytosine1962-C5)-methyltransferase